MEHNQKLLSFLKQFFIQRPELHHSDYDYLVPTGAFYQLLDKERFRADRLGNTFALVTISLPEALRIPKNLQELVTEVHRQTRLIDELGWFAPSVLGLYVFNARHEEAELTLQRIRQHLRCPEWLDDVEIMVYPDMHVEALEIQRSETQKECDAVNQRIQERLNLHLSAIIQPSGVARENAQISGSSQRDSATTRDISASGTFLVTSQRLPEGTEFELGIVLPVDELKPLAGDDESHEIMLKATGRVVRIEADGMAVAFDEPHTVPSLQSGQ